MIASACTRSPGKSPSALFTILWRITRLTPAKAALSISTVKWLSPEPSSPEWPRCRPLSLITASCVGRRRRLAALPFQSGWSLLSWLPLPISCVFGQGGSMSAPRNPDRFHGRMRGSRLVCEHPQCERAGEFRAPNPYGRSSGPNGPGDYLWFCLDHVREFNAGYDWFEGMSADEISKAQSPLNVWPSETRAFRTNGSVDSPLAGPTSMTRWRPFLHASGGEWRR